MIVLIYKNNVFTGHFGHIKNMEKIAKVLVEKHPTSTIEMRKAKDKTASTPVTRF